MPTYVLDTCCWINAAQELSRSGAAVLAILAAADAGHIQVLVSAHSLEELRTGGESATDKALPLARNYRVVPYNPAGAIGDLLGRVCELPGTIADIADNQAAVDRLQRVAKRHPGIRDCGAALDTMRAGADAFVTSDGDWTRPAPASRILAGLGLRVLTPEVVQLMLP
jgi:hypothetical protein